MAGHDDEQESEVLSPGRQKYVIGVFLIFYVFAYMDRNILSMLVEPIKLSLHITDVQFSLIQGLAFGAFYALFGLPMGWIVDRFSKRWVLFWGILSWSASTVACGLARSFPMLAVARFGVGAGEATLIPAAYATITRIMPRHRTALGIAIFSMGSLFGAAIAAGLGGLLIRQLTAANGIVLPFIGHLEPWQAVFLVLGLPGVAIAFLAFTLPETRNPRDHGQEVGAPSLMAFLNENRRYLAFLIGALSMTTTIAYAVNSWMPALLIRQYGFAVSDIGFILSISTIAGIPGYLSTGYLSDRLFRDGRKDGHILPILYGTPLIILVSVVGFYLTTNKWIAIACFAAITPLIAIANSISTHIQLVTPAPLRGRIAAITVAAQHLCGIALGPLLVALVTDKIFGDPARVGYSMAIVAVSMAIPTLYLYGRGRKYACEAVLRAEAAGR